MEFNTMDPFLCIHALFWGFFPWPTPIPKYTKTGKTWSSYGLHLSKALFSMKSWVKHLQWLSMYHSLTLMWGIWVQTAQIFSMPQILYNQWPSDDLETTWVRHCLMQNIKLMSLHYLHVYLPINWGIWAQIF